MSAGLHVILYTPHPGQAPIHASTARFRIATCGRKFGKTTMAVNELAKYALEHPRKETAWIAPTYGQTDLPFEWMCERLGNAFAETPNLSRRKIVWKGGTTTQFKSADNYNALRGPGFDFIVGDEFGTWPKEAWEAVVRPTLSFTQGGALLVGTPRGRNLFWDLWSRGQDRERWPEYASWQLPSSANPFMPEGEIESARESLPVDTFRQEYEAQFLQDSTGVFRNLDRCAVGHFASWEERHSYVIGWDPAKHADASVITVLDGTRGTVVAWERILRTDYTLQLTRVAMLARQYRAFVLMDSTGVGDPLLEQLRALDVSCEGFSFTNASKQQLVEHLAVRVEKVEVTWPAELVVLHNELAAFQYEITRAGNVRYSAPEGRHDDCVMSLGLAVWAARHYAVGAPLAANLAAAAWTPTEWEALRAITGN